MLKDKFKVSGWWAAAPLFILCSMGIVAELRLCHPPSLLLLIFLLPPPSHLPPSSSFSSSSSLFLKGFNTELEELHKVQQNWSIPDPHLRARIRGDNVEIVAPVYAEFYRVWVMHGSRMSECASIRIIIQARDGKCPWTKVCSGSIFFFLGMQRWTSPRTRTNTWSILLIAWTANCDHFLMVVYEYGV